MMKVVDIKTCAEIVHEHNKDTVVVVDNTFMSAYFQVRRSEMCSSRSLEFETPVNGNLHSRFSSCGNKQVIINPGVCLGHSSAPWLWELMSACIQLPST